MFKIIIMGYLDGDKVQGSDYFSTVGYKSYKKMSDIVDLELFLKENSGYSRCDMRFVVNKRDKRVTHTNMWFMGRSKKIFNFMDPLPLVVLVPFIVSQFCYISKCTDCEVHLNSSIGACSVVTLSCQDCLVTKDKCTRKLEYSLYRILTYWSTKGFLQWRSKKDKSRNILLNYKNAKAIRDTLFH